MLSEKYELEKIWDIEEFSLDANPDAKITPAQLGEIVVKLLNNLKLRRIIIKIKQVERKIADLSADSQTDHAEVMEWMRKLMILNEIKVTLVNAMKRSAVQ